MQAKLFNKCKKLPSIDREHHLAKSSEFSAGVNSSKIFRAEIHIAYAEGADINIMLIDPNLEKFGANSINFSRLTKNDFFNSQSLIFLA